MSDVVSYGFIQFLDHHWIGWTFSKALCWEYTSKICSRDSRVGPRWLSYHYHHDFERFPPSQSWVNAPLEGRQRPNLDYLVWMLYFNLAGHGWEKWKRSVSVGPRNHIEWYPDSFDDMISEFWLFPATCRRQLLFKVFRPSGISRKLQRSTRR